MRTALETDLSVRELFASVVDGITESASSKITSRTHSSSKTVQAAGKRVYYPFIITGPGSATKLAYRVLECPWPLSTRDCFTVQDYVLRDDDEEEDGAWFFTIMQNIEHSYFAPRKGFVRVQVRY